MMGQLLAIAGKELRLLRRDPAGLLLLFLMPAVFILVLSVALQGAFAPATSGERVPVLVVNEDRGSVGDQLMEALQRSAHFEPITEVDGRPADAEQATALVAEQRCDAAVLIPPAASDALGFEHDAMIEVIYDPAIPDEFSAALEHTLRGAIHGAAITALAAKNHAQTAAIDDLERRLAGLAAVCALPQTRAEPEHAPPPPERWPDHACEHPSTFWPKHALERWGLQVDRVPARAAHAATVRPNSVQQNVPGWTIFALFWIAQILALNLINERSAGIYRRLLVAPLPFRVYVAGKALPYLLVNLAQAAVMFALGVHVLPLLGCPRLELVDPPLLLLVTLAISAAAIGLGLLIATVARSALMASAGSAALLITMTALGGIMVPKLVMPDAMQTATKFVPHGWALEAYLDVLVRGAGLEAIWPQLAALLGFAAACFLFALARLRRIGR